MFAIRTIALGLAWVLAASAPPSTIGPAPRQDKGGETVSFELAHGIILVKGSVNGKDGYTFVFDCGANHTILTPETAKELGIRGTKVRDQSGLDLEMGRAESLALGGVAVKGIDVIIWDPPQAKPLQQLGKTYHGFVGYPFLSRFVVTIDYRASQIRLASPDTPSEVPAPVLGLKLEETRVAEVEKGSAGEKAGFRSGDVVLKLNALTLAGAADVAAIVKVAKAGDALTFTVRRDKKEQTLKMSRP